MDSNGDGTVSKEELYEGTYVIIMFSISKSL